MKTVLTTLTAALALAFGPGSASAALTESPDGAIVDIGLDQAVSGYHPSGSTTPWVNARFKELGGAYYGNTVELQITDSTLGAGGPFPVAGLGNLGASEHLNKLYLNFNPLRDISKLRLLRVDGSDDSNGLPGNFPDNGVEPKTITISQGGFNVGGGIFDIRIEWDPSLFQTLPNGDIERHVKLLFEYDGGNTDIDASDFAMGSGNSMFALAQISGAVTAGPGTGLIGAVPEPGSLALLGATFLGLGWMRRRVDA